MNSDNILGHEYKNNLHVKTSYRIWINWLKCSEIT